MNNNNWVLFHFSSGGNPYIAKNEKEKNKILEKYNCLFIEEKSNNYFILDNVINNVNNMVEIIDEQLTLYTNDEAGETQKETYKSMTKTQKINLFYNTLYFNTRVRDYYDFVSDIIINFNYGNY